MGEQHSNVPPLASLIEALQIVAKYVDPQNSYCHSERDLLLLPLGMNTALDIDDEEQLRRLGANPSVDFDCWTLPT